MELETLESVREREGERVRERDGLTWDLELALAFQEL